MMSQFEPEQTIFERERTILEEIQKNPNLHHNALIKLIVPKHMAKTTFENTKNRMIEMNVLSVVNKGNKKVYNIPKDYQKRSLQTIERVVHEKYQHLKHNIKKIKEDYIHKDVDEKILICANMVRNLLQTDNGFTFLDSIKNSKKTLYKDEHLAIQEMISKIYEIISKDKDKELIFPIIISNDIWNTLK